MQLCDIMIGKIRKSNNYILFWRQKIMKNALIFVIAQYSKRIDFRDRANFFFRKKTEHCFLLILWNVSYEMSSIKYVWVEL